MCSILIFYKAKCLISLLYGQFFTLLQYMISFSIEAQNFLFSFCSCFFLDLIPLFSWSYNSSTYSTGGVRTNNSNLVDCLTYCEYLTPCLAIDFDRRISPAICWIYQDPNFLSQTFQDQNIEQYRLNRLSIANQESS